MEPEQLEIWAEFLSSDIKLEILQLFHTHPKLTSSSEEIAKQIRRTKEEIQSELHVLVTMGVIRKNGEPGLFCLGEDTDRDVQTQICRYLLRGTDWTTSNYCERFC